jgi:cell division septum initiation protein DivIVA
VARKPDQSNDASWAYLAPSDLREHDLPSQAALGFHRGSTEELLNRAADTIERLQRELLLAQEAREVDRQERSELEAGLEEAQRRAELLVGEAMLDAHKATQVLMAQAEAEAKAMRDEAEAILTPARQEAERLVAEARVHAMQLVSDAEGECERLAAQAEQYKLLAADVQRRSVDFLQRALEALGAGTADSAVAGDEVAPFRTSDERAAGW